MKTENDIELDFQTKYNSFKPLSVSDHNEYIKKDINFNRENVINNQYDDEFFDRFKENYKRKINNKSDLVFNSDINNNIDIDTDNDIDNKYDENLFDINNNYQVHCIYDDLSQAFLEDIFNYGLIIDNDDHHCNNLNVHVFREPNLLEKNETVESVAVKPNSVNESEMYIESTRFDHSNDLKSIKMEEPIEYNQNSIKSPFHTKMTFGRAINIDHRWQDFTVSYSPGHYSNQNENTSRPYYPHHNQHTNFHNNYYSHSHMHHHHHHHHMNYNNDNLNRTMIVHDPLMTSLSDVNPNVSTIPYSNIGSAVASSINLTNSNNETIPENNSHYRNTNSNELMYYQNNSAETSNHSILTTSTAQSDGLISNYITDEEFRFPDMSMNEDKNDPRNSRYMDNTNIQHFAINNRVNYNNEQINESQSLQNCVKLSKNTCRNDYEQFVKDRRKMSQPQNTQSYTLNSHLDILVPNVSSTIIKDKKSTKKSEEHLTRDEKRARALNVPISVDDIINLPMDEFNERLSKFDLSEPQLSLIRDIRRRGKNKVAAQNCRKRKLDQITHLSLELKDLKSCKSDLNNEFNSLKSELSQLKIIYDELVNILFQNVHDSHGLLYSPEEYKLEFKPYETVTFIRFDKKKLHQSK